MEDIRGLVLDTLFLRSSTFISATCGTSRGRKETSALAQYIFGPAQTQALTPTTTLVAEYT